jgi:hypothetical protein
MQTPAVKAAIAEIAVDAVKQMIDMFHLDEPEDLDLNSIKTVMEVVDLETDAILLRKSKKDEDAMEYNNFKKYGKDMYELRGKIADKKLTLSYSLQTEYEKLNKILFLQPWVEPKFYTGPYGKDNFKTVIKEFKEAVEDSIKIHGDETLKEKKAALKAAKANYLSIGNKPGLHITAVMHYGNNNNNANQNNNNNANQNNSFKAKKEAAKKAYESAKKGYNNAKAELKAAKKAVQSAGGRKKQTRRNRKSSRKNRRF